MEFVNLKLQYKYMEQEINNAIQKVLSKGHYIMGQEVAELETRLSRYVNVKHTITCDNGTNAIVMSLEALGIKSGDGVIVPAMTYFATAEAVSATGAIPIFCDVDESTFNICPKSLESTIIKVKKEAAFDLKAVIAVDLYGLPSEYEEIHTIAKAHGIFVIEDGAQGFGGMIGHKKVGSFAVLSTTSFFPSKPLGCYGDGGAIFTDNDEYASYLKSVRHHGMGKDKYDNIRIGHNSRLDTIQAAILMVKMKYLDEEIKNRQKTAERYTERLCNIVKCPIVPEGYSSSWAQYTIKLESELERERLMLKLKEQDIPAIVYYQIPLHLQKAYKFLGYREGDIPVSENLSKTILSLPISGYITNDEIDKICDVLKSEFS